MCGFTKMSKVPSLMRILLLIIVFSCNTFAVPENTSPEIESVKSFHDVAINPVEIDSATNQIRNGDIIKTLSDVPAAESDVADINSLNAVIPSVDNSQRDLDNINIDAESGPSVVTDILIDICELCFCNETEYLDKTPFLDIVCYRVDKEMRDWKTIWPTNEHNYDIEATFQNLGWTKVPILPRNKKIVAISFFDNLIDNINPRAFANLGNLMSLILKKNNLREITALTFNGLKHLEELDLSQNKFDSIGLLNFTELTVLKKLWLSENALEVFPDKALSHITTLEFLDCSHNEIYDLTIESSVISNLKILNLSHNKLTRILSKDFKGGYSLEKIDLSFNMITKIESNAFDGCTGLKELVLSNNKLDSIPSLPNVIESIFLQHNGLHSWMNIPNDVRYLDISYNILSTMSEENFQNLENLNLKGNHLYEFNTRFPFNKLKILDISYNRLEKVPANFNITTLPSLDELYLDGNPLRELIFTGEIALRKLSANNLDEIESLNETSFRTLSGRPLQNADGSTMPEDVICLNITISQCKKLETIPDKTFQNISLCYLDLSYNHLRKLSEDVADWPSLFKGVNLQGNPWDCGCHLQWFLDELLLILFDNNPHLLNELRCYAPQPVKDMRFVHWYKWQGKAFCRSNLLEHRSYDKMMMGSSSNMEDGTEWDTKTIGLVFGIIILSIVTIGLVIYLINGKHRHDTIVRKLMLKKRQSMSDAQKLNNRRADQQNYALIGA